MTVKPASPLNPSSPIEIEDSIEWPTLRSAWIRQLGIDPGTPPNLNNQQILLCRCKRSQLRFFWPLSLAAAPEFYAHLELFPWYYRSEKWEYDAALKRLQNGGHLLDIGCGSGHFLRLASAAGWRASGLESNQKAASEGIKNGFDIRSETVEVTLGNNRETFDVVTAFQVLEHIPEPAPFLAAAVTLLKPGGQLVIGVPDSAGWIDRAGSVMECPPHHVTRWNGAALQYLTKILPLELDTMEIEPLDPIHASIYVRANLHPVTQLEMVERKQPLAVRVVARLMSVWLKRSALRTRLRGATRLAIFVKRR